MGAACPRQLFSENQNQHRRGLTGSLDRPAAFVDAPLSPVFTVKGIKVVLHPLKIVSVATDQLGEKVATLAQEGDRTTSAMDELLMRAWS